MMVAPRGPKGPAAVVGAMTSSGCFRPQCDQARMAGRNTFEQPGGVTGAGPAGPADGQSLLIVQKQRLRGPAAPSKGHSGNQPPVRIESGGRGGLDGRSSSWSEPIRCSSPGSGGGVGAGSPACWNSGGGTGGIRSPAGWSTGANGSPSSTDAAGLGGIGGSVDSGGSVGGGGGGGEPKPAGSPIGGGGGTGVGRGICVVTRPLGHGRSRRRHRRFGRQRGIGWRW